MRVDVARAEVDVLTPKGRQQTVPLDWIEAVRNAEAQAPDVSEPDDFLLLLSAALQ